MNGYEQLMPVDIKVRADNLEITAGWPDESTVDRQLEHMLDTVSIQDADELRWTACCIAAKLDYLDARS